MGAAAKTCNIDTTCACSRDGLCREMEGKTARRVWDRAYKECLDYGSWLKLSYKSMLRDYSFWREIGRGPSTQGEAGGVSTWRESRHAQMRQNANCTQQICGIYVA
jgi:hypothetical protein